MPKNINMKYRILSIDELQELEKEFITFLSAQSITSDLWEEMKAKQADRAQLLIEQFSDIVFEKVISNIEYLEQKSKREIRLFHCLPEKIKMLGLVIQGDTQLDFTQNMSPEQMMQHLQLSGAGLKMYQGERAYKKQREIELFELMEQGALISKDGALYKTLESLSKE
jgi:hypothetical protein